MDVSRETLNRLEIYLALLKKWNRRINLVSPATLHDAAARHFEDSQQISDLWKAGQQNWVDLGSGGGFPGAVVAIVLAPLENAPHITLVESDQRKSTFLRTVSRETSVPFSVVAKRIEDVPPLQSDVVSARALADLTKLLEHADRHLITGGTAIFPKGATWRQEITSAQKQWRFSFEAHKSKTNPDAVILEIGNLIRA